MASDIKVILKGEDQTGAAASKAKSNIKSVGEAAQKNESMFKSMGKALAGAFAAEKLIEFGKASLTMASQNNPALKKSLEGVANQFKGLQMGVGQAILGNEQFMGTLTSLAKGVIPVVVTALQFTVGVVNTLVSVLKMGFTNLSILFKLVTGQLSIREAWDAYKQNAVNTFDSVKTAVTGAWDGMKKAWDTDYQHVGSLAGSPAKQAAEKKAVEDKFKHLKDQISSLASLDGLNDDQKSLLRFLAGGASRQAADAIARGDFKAASELQGIIKKAESALGANRPTGLLRLGDAFASRIGQDTSFTDSIRNQASQIDVSNIDLSGLTNLQASNGIQFAASFKDALGPLSQINTEAQNLNTTLGDLAGNALVNFQQGFANAFEAIGQGVPVFRALGEAAKQAIVQSAAAQGREQFAKGTAALASGFMGAPNAFPAAAKHFAAGAMFMSLAGLGGGSGGRGGGGTSGAIADRDNIVRPETVQQGEANITIQGGILDMTNPEQARALAQALQRLSNKRVNILTTTGATR